MGRRLEIRPAGLAKGTYIGVEQEGCNCGRREGMFGRRQFTPNVVKTEQEGTTVQ